MKLLYTEYDWTFELIEKTWTAIDDIGKNHFKLDYYTPQIEVISSEQMLDAYSSVAMPIMYNHWSFGKSFVNNEKDYKKGRTGLAYEVVINTNPCLTYLMEDNSMTLQALVMAHAACGHSSFFKTNYLFRGWTDAEYILDYLKYAKNYIAECEQKYGHQVVERILDACHALKYFGVDKYKRPPRLQEDVLRQKIKESEEQERVSFNDLWRTTKKATPYSSNSIRVNHQDDMTQKVDWDFPEENLLLFIEKQSTTLRPWVKEIIRIVRKISQYFYPQMQTQLMNEGWATFIHYHIMLELYERGQISEGSYLEFLSFHSAVIYQPPYTHAGYSGINVYALGFAIMMDIKRICQDPTEEDRYWFPQLIGQDWLTTLKDIIENYRDESFILQFLSPKVIRDFKFFLLSDADSEYKEEYVVDHVHDDIGVLKIRDKLSQYYSLSYRLPQIELVGADVLTSRMCLQYHMIDDKILKWKECRETLSYFEFLWGHIEEFDVQYLKPDGSQYDGPLS